MTKLLLYTMIALVGLACLVVAVIFLPQGDEKEKMALLLGPLSGICLAIIMHFADIDLKFSVSFALQKGKFSLQITKP